MKKIILISAVFTMVLISSCKKEITNNITETEKYTKTPNRIAGTWRVLLNSTITNENYFVFDKNMPYFTQYSVKNGIRSKQISPYKFTDKIIDISQIGSLNYLFSGDTAILSNGEIEIKMVPFTNLTLLEDWIGTVGLDRTVNAIPSMNYNNKGFGFNGDFIYASAQPYGVYKVYQYNTLNGNLVDSVNTGIDMSTYYLSTSNTFFYGSTGNSSKLYKTIGLSLPSVPVSTNNLTYVYNVSRNNSSGTIYAYQSDKKLFAGTDGGAFSLLYDFNNLAISLKDVIYYKNDEFLARQNNTIVQIKISPTFQIVKSYSSELFDNFNSFEIYSMSTNGTDVWVYGQDDNDDKYKFKKIILN